MSNFGDHPAGFFGQSEFYNEVTSTSLKLDPNGYLQRQPSSAGNQKTWTYSTWVKRTNVGSTQQLLAIGNTSSSPWFLLYFSGSDQINAYWYTNGTVNSNQSWEPKLRDMSAWYNIVLRNDTTQSTASNRAKLYINGVEATPGNSQWPTENYDTLINGTSMHFIGRQGGGQYLNAYISETIMLDGTSTDASAFGEFKNGIWIPIEPDVTYGTNGFRLQFKGSNADDSIDGPGGDTSGNTHHFTRSGITDGTDAAIPDCPENNFCVLGGAQTRRYGASHNSTMTEGNLKAATGGNASHNFGTMAINQVCANGSGVYFEIRNVSIDGNRNYGGVVGDSGVNNESSAANGASYSFPIKGLIGLMASPRGYFNTATDASGSLDLTANANFVNGDVIGFAIKSDGKFFVHRNGTYLDNADGNTGNPTTGANPIATIDLTEGDWFPYCGYNSTLHANFGQDGSFTGTETSGGNSDANGFGDFMFAVPTGYLAICSANMVKPAIGPDSGSQANDYFNAVTYTGNGGTLSVSGFGFQPDLLWIKSRNITGNQRWTDSSRGVSFNIISSADDAEKGDSDAEDIDSFDADGFTVTQASYDDFNDGSDTYVAWGWKANAGTDTASASESGDNPAYNQQANAKAGFSIIKYTGTQAAGTIPHGLGAVPKWMVFKNREVDGNAWIVYHSENTTAPETDHLRLGSGSGSNTTADSDTRFNDTAPTSSVFTLGADGNINDDGVGCMGYIWTPIEGFSKFGSFIGNGNNDGPFVYTGFLPRWIMIKNSEASANWRMHDTARQTLNDDGGHLLLADSNSAEITNEYDLDFLANGFKLRSSDLYENGAGQVMVYMAFATNPFKYTNAR